MLVSYHITRVQSIIMFVKRILFSCSNAQRRNISIKYHQCVKKGRKKLEIIFLVLQDWDVILRKVLNNYIIFNSLPRTWSSLFVPGFVPIIRDNNYWGTFFRSYYTTDSTTASSETTENIASILPTQQTMIVIFLF